MVEGGGDSRTPRVVLIGASNVTKSLSVIIDIAHQLLGKPLDIFTALGLGRSYGLFSRVLGRGLPSIRDCGLWDALRAEGPSETYALLTDIGNDLAYEAPAKEIVAWIEGQEFDPRISDGRELVTSRTTLTCRGPTHFSPLFRPGFQDRI